jgi:transcriptional regulator with XRE-family HTH domain
MMFTVRDSPSMIDKSLKNFGKRVRELRERSGLSQEALAAKAGIHRTYMGGIERGERNLCLKNILRLAAAIGVPPGDLFEETGTP